MNRKTLVTIATAATMILVLVAPATAVVGARHLASAHIDVGTEIAIFLEVYGFWVRDDPMWGDYYKNAGMKVFVWIDYHYFHVVDVTLRLLTEYNDVRTYSQLYDGDIVELKRGRIHSPGISGILSFTAYEDYGTPEDYTVRIDLPDDDETTVYYDFPLQ